MLTKRQYEVLFCMQMITLAEGETIPNEEVYQVTEWAEKIQAAYRAAKAGKIPAEHWKDEVIVRAAHVILSEVLQGKLAVHVVKGKVRTCPLDEIPAER